MTVALAPTKLSVLAVDLGGSRATRTGGRHFGEGQPAQTLRLSIVYALLDGSAEVREPHLTAALAVWTHAEASARRLFGDVLGLPLADRVLALLRDKGPMTTEQIHRALAGHAKAEALAGALATLETKGLARRKRIETKGRPAVVWEAVPR